MLSRLQANSVIRNFTERDGDRWTVAIPVLCNYYIVGFIEKEDGNFSVFSSIQKEVVYKNYNKALCSLLDEFSNQIEISAVNICQDLRENKLQFNDLAIEIIGINKDLKKIRFCLAGQKENFKDVDCSVFAKNYVLGNVKIA